MRDKDNKIIQTADPIAGGFHLFYNMASGIRYEVGLTTPSTTRHFDAHGISLWIVLEEYRALYCDGQCVLRFGRFAILRSVGD